uniref:Uncharacterized protein n=1 Tax=Hucho hucho TaxID=62062 RepID=A0A4W5QFU8_9TELE
MTSSSVYPQRCLLPLVDIYGVIADLEGGFLKKFHAKYPNELYITLEDRQGFWVSSQYGNLRRVCSLKSIPSLPDAKKHPHSMMLPPPSLFKTMVTGGILIDDTCRAQPNLGAHPVHCLSQQKHNPQLQPPPAALLGR